MNLIMPALIGATPLLIGQGDPFWDDVRLLVKMNGAHGDPLNDLVDLSGYHTSFTYSSPTPFYSNVQSKFGGTSGLFDTVSNIRFARTEIGAELAGDMGDWTIEYWAFTIASTNTPVMAIGTYDASTICFWMGDSTANYYNICWTTTSLNRWVVGPQVPPNGSQLYTLNNWHFHSLCKNAALSEVYHHIDGVRVATSTDMGAFPSNVTEGIVLGGVDSAFGFYGRSYIQEARITKAARYTSADYTPPAASFPVGP